MVAPADAATITLNDPGIVGAVDGQLVGGTNPVNEEKLVEHLLAMAISTTEVVVTPAVQCATALQPCEFRTGDNHYAAADVTYIGKLDGNNPNIAAAHQGDVFVIAKYDGKNGGYVVFYLPDWNANPANTDNVLPTSAETIFGKYEISHYAAFRAPRVNVPDGGATLLLLGCGLVGLGALRRVRGR
jgi:hypothetical protein